jgi:hypothetical protein
LKNDPEVLGSFMTTEDEQLYSNVSHHSLEGRGQERPDCDGDHFLARETNGAIPRWIDQKELFT